MEDEEKLTPKEKIRLERSLKPGARGELRFNGGKGAVLCSVCFVILLVGSKIDWEAAHGGTLKPHYCPEHTPEKITAGLVAS